MGAFFGRGSDLSDLGLPDLGLPDLIGFFPLDIRPFGFGAFGAFTLGLNDLALGLGKLNLNPPLCLFLVSILLIF